MILERCTPDHLLSLDLQPVQQPMRAYMTPDYLNGLLVDGRAFTVIDVRPVMCFGFQPWTEARGCVWAYFSRDARRHMVALHRYAEWFISTLRGRIFATVECGFAAGTRWVELLGFSFLDTLPEYGAAKLPHNIYLQVRA